MVLFKNKNTYIGFNQLVSVYLMKNIPTLRMIACCVEYTGDFQTDRTNLYRQNRINKNRRPIADMTAVTPMTQLDPMTFLPVAHKDSKNEQSLSADRYYKQQAFYSYAKNKDDDLKNLEEGIVAVIYIDSNSMGAKLKKCSDSDYNEGVRKLREFSETVDCVFVKEPLEKIKRAITNTQLEGFRRVIGGGDEITFICKAELALKLLEVYFDSLEESNKDKCEENKNYACAGIAIFHAKAPFTVAYEIAEEACECAKEKAHIRNDNYFDVYYCHAGVTAEFKTLRKREQHMTARPYCYREVKQDFEKYTPLLQKIGRSNVKAFNHSAQKGKPHYLFELKRINGYLGNQEGFSAEESQLDEQMKMIYDMSEFYDLWFKKEENADEKNS